MAPLGPSRPHRFQEGRDRLLVSTLHQVLKPGEGDQPRRRGSPVRPGSRSGTGRAGTARPGPARRGCSLTPAELLELLAGPELLRQAEPAATSSRIERSRTVGSAWVIVSMRSWPTSTWIDDQRSRGYETSGTPGVESGQRAHSARPARPIPAAARASVPDRAGEGQGDLGLDHAELDPEVVPGPPGFERQVTLALGQARSRPSSVGSDPARGRRGGPGRRAVRRR